MRVTVQLFAVARDLAGCEAVDVELPAGADVAALRHAMARQSPALAELVKTAAIAVNAQYAGDATPIPNGADVAVIPPVSGG